MAEINYPQRWLRDLKAKTSTLGWFKDLGFEVLKTQKNLEYEPIDVTDCFIVIPENVNCLDVIPIDFKFLPRVATELNYTINTSDTTICVFDEENNSLVFLNKPGSVTITVEMATGSATFEKTINVLKNADVATIEEGNTFVKDTVSPLTIKLLPNDTTEKVIDVSVWNTNDITITKLVSEIEENNKYEVISSNVGSYDLKINTNVRSYKVPIYFVETPGLVVENISFQEKDYYQFNETIYILPELLPDTARFKSYNVLVDDQNIAVWNSGKNAIITKDINGVTSATIKMNQGLAEYKFDINVKDDSTIVPITDINITNLPQSITKGQKMELELNITPPNGTIDDLVITSTPEAIIKKENGKWFVTGASIGTATITAESARSNFSKNFTLEILTNIVLVSEISTTTIPDTLLLGGSETFTVSVLPLNASDATYTITTSENLNLVNNTNNNYTITSTSLGAGWVKIVANDASGIELTKNITVNPVLVSGFTTTTIPTTTIIENEIEFDVTPTPENATDKTYTVTGTGFTITDKGNGKYGAVSNAVGAGNIKITASDAGGYVLTKNITVNPVLVSTVTLSTIPDSLILGTDQEFTVSVLPENATNKTYTVTTSTNLTLVDAGSGNYKVTPNALGAGWIKATANDASGISTTKNVTVNPVLVTGFTTSTIPTSTAIGSDITFDVTPTPANATNKAFTVTATGFTIKDNGNNNYTATATTVGAGNIKITASDSGAFVLNKAVTVNPILVSGFTTTTISETTTIGSDITFDVTPTPANATNKAFTVTATGFTITDNGNNNYTATATTVGAGNIKITASDSGAYTTTKNVTVNPILVSGFTTTAIPTTSVIGTAITFDVTPTPANATNKAYTVTGTGFTIKDNGNNNYTATSTVVGAGNIKITASDAGAFVLTKNITVNPILVSTVTLSAIPDTLLTGGDTTFTVSVLPVNATNKTYTVTTSANIGFVDNGSNSFTATANSAGAGWIKVTANDASGVSTTKNITISDPVVLVTSLTYDVPETIVQTDTLDTSTVVVAPSDATNKTYTVAVVSGLATIEGSIVSFSDVGEVTISITANDASEISINKTFEVTTAP